MLFQKSKIALLIVLLTFFANNADGQRKKTGNLFGHVGFLAEKEGGYAVPINDAVIKIRRNKREIIRISTNEVGLIFEELKKGNYCLDSVHTKIGVQLRISPSQILCFEIKPGETERFDTALLNSN